MRYVYIISNANRTLYVGIAADVLKRMTEHKAGTFENAFTRRYNFDRLVYVEPAPTVRDEARREKQLKGWTRARKIALIESSNPDWADLSSSWIELLRF
jgi:putative endonuclease